MGKVNIFIFLGSGRRENGANGIENKKSIVYNRQTDTHSDRQTGIEGGGWRHRPMDRHTQADTQTDIQLDIQTDKQTH